MADSASNTTAAESASAADNCHGADPVLLSQLLEMGVHKTLAVRALLLSGNSSVEAAFTWIMELSAEEQEEVINRHVDEDGSSEWEDVEEAEAPDASPKMVLVVDVTLGMGPGKIAAQVGHAVLGMYQKLQGRHRTNLWKWQTYGEKMVVVRGSGSSHLKELKQKADALRLPTHLFADAGLTQIAAGSHSVLAVFGLSGEVDSVTGGLKLL